MWQSDENPGDTIFCITSVKIVIHVEERLLSEGEADLEGQLQSARRHGMVWQHPGAQTVGTRAGPGGSLQDFTSNPSAEVGGRAAQLRKSFWIQGLCFVWRWIRLLLKNSSPSYMVRIYFPHLNFFLSLQTLYERVTAADKTCPNMNLNCSLITLCASTFSFSYISFVDIYFLFAFI